MQWDGKYQMRFYSVTERKDIKGHMPGMAYDIAKQPPE